MTQLHHFSRSEGSITTARSEPQTPLFSIIVPTLGVSETLSLCLESCLRQAVDEFCFEVVVVANPPNEQVESLVTRLAMNQDRALHYLNSDTKGVNRARNRGAKFAHGEFLLFLDDDCILPDPNWLRSLAIRWKATPDVVGIGGSYSNTPDATWLERGANFIANAWAGSKPQGVRLLGGNACYKKKVLIDQGLFCEAIASGGDESELNRRLQLSGYKLRWVDDLAVIHMNGSTIQKTIKRALSHGLAAARFELDTMNEIKTDSLARLKLWSRSINGDWAILPYLCLHYGAYFLARAIGPLGKSINLKFGIESEEHIHR